MAKNRTRRNTKKLQQQDLTLNAAIGIVGVLLLGFIYSFSQNTSYTGVPIEVEFPDHKSAKKLAKDFYDENQIHTQSNNLRFHCFPFDRYKQENHLHSQKGMKM